MFLTWFPPRVCAKWYRHFFTLDLRTYQAFLLLLFLAFVSLMWLVFIVKPSRALITIPAIVSVLSIAFAGLGVSVALVVTGVMRRRRAGAPLEEFNPS